LNVIILFVTLFSMLLEHNVYNNKLTFCFLLRLKFVYKHLDKHFYGILQLKE